MYPQSWIYGGLSQPEILFRLFSSPYTRLKVKFLPVMYCEDSENAQLQDNRVDAAHAARRYGTKVRKAMCEALSVAASAHSVEDVWLQKEALKRKMPANAGVVEYKNITNKFEVNLDTIKKYQETFAAIDKDKSGSVSLDEFLSIYGQEGKAMPELESLFHLLDDNDDGEVNFKEYLIGLALMISSDKDEKDANVHEDKVLRLAFRILDKNGNDRVEVEDVFSFLKRQDAHVNRDEFDELVIKCQNKSTQGGLDYDSFLLLARSKSLYNTALHHMIPR